MNSLVNFVLNTLVISVPEEFFITYIILFFLKVFRVINHQYLDIHDDLKGNLFKIFTISVIPMALLSNILLVFKVSSSVTPFVGIIATFITIIILCKTKKTYQILLTFLLTILGMMILCGIQAVIYQCVFVITNTNLEYFLQKEYLKIILTSFTVMIEYIIIILSLFCKNRVIKTDVVKQVFRSKPLLIIIFTYILINAICFMLVFKSIIADNLLNILNININYQILITFLLLLWACINITAIWLVPTIIQMNEKYRNKYGRGIN